MAITQTNKLGLPLYSAGTDPHPGRVDHNTIMQAINDNAMGVKQGLHASRPGAGVAGRTYFSTDRSTFSYDTGTNWADYTPIGGVAPSGVRAGATGPVLSGAGGTEGTSARLARADHTHALPLATDDLPGLLHADMYYLLARMTDAATPSTVVRRDAAARISVGTPTSAVHAATKAYADLVASNASNLTTGTVAVERLPLATASAAGVMSATDKAKLDGASATTVNGSLVLRTGAGNIYGNALFIDGVQTNQGNVATRKDYVDAQDAAARAYADSLVGTSAAPLNHTHAASDTTTGVFAAARLPLASASAAGAMSAAHFSLLAGATNAATPNTLVKNDANGRFQTTAPSAAADVANKGYVDGKTWSGSDITSGTISPLRVANATSALDGLMPKADKAKLDAATAAATANTLVMHDSAGRFQVPAPSSNSADVVNRGYVDGKTWDGSDITSGLINQARIANATSSLNGLMSSTDKAKLDGAAYTSIASSIALRNSLGNIRFNSIYLDGTTNAADSAARKDYVDAQDAKQVSLAGDLSSADLNTVITPGDYYASSTANGTTANNYPMNGVGTLSVRRFHSSSVWVIQTFQSWNSNRMFARSANSSTGWTAWVEFTNSDNVGSIMNTGTVITGNVDLNSYTTPGVYTNAANAQATGGTNYPGTLAGKLEVFAAANSSFVWQTYQEYGNSGRFYFRARYSGTWAAWQEMATDKTASALAYAAADGPGALGDFNSYTKPGPYILQGNGLNVPTTFLEVFSVPSGGVFQRRTVDNAVHVRNRLSNGTWTSWITQ